MRSKITRWALFGALLLALVPGPVFAACNPAGDEGCCCHKGDCSTSPRPRAQTCCNSQDSPPAPAPDVAPTSSAPQVEDLPPKPEVVDGSPILVIDPSLLGNAPNRQIPPDLYTLHASLLI